MGNDDPRDGAAGDHRLLELQTNYWLKRLDHTLTHTQTSSRLIYIVDGAVLALIYFAIQRFPDTRLVFLWMSFPTMLLVFLNLFHARLILIQRSHYVGIDEQLRRLLNPGEVQHQVQRNVLASTHRIYCGMHIAIAAFLAVAAASMFL